ncbi:baseplate tail tube cap [Ochrobactrum phage vB_OspM_OC]|nr:baseplate tail tube cap [Ochrobactrum phage vB_OspM_OC]
MSILKFPNDFEETNGNWLLFTEYEYSRPSRNKEAVPLPTGNSISLPVPINMEANHVADWENASMGAWNAFLQDHSGAIANTAKDITTGLQSGKLGYMDIASTINSQLNIPTLAGGIMKAASTDMMTGNQIFRNISATVGLAKNPFQAVMFNQMNLRTFNFQYKLVPKSYEDSEHIRDIIKSFKRAMHPEVGEGYLNNLMKYPNMYGIRFTDTSVQDMLFKFGMCVLTEVGVNYHGEGGPNYLQKDGKRAPASIMLSLTFREIEMNTKESIDEGR